jgi:hypothetical protein
MIGTRWGAAEEQMRMIGLRWDAAEEQRRKIGLNLIMGFKLTLKVD